MTAPLLPGLRATSRDKRREDTRKRIYQSAMDIFRRDGYAVARIDDIAKAAGVSHGAFYFHFATKEEVLAECLRDSEARVAAHIDQLAKSTKLPLLLDAVGAAIANEWVDDPRIFPDVAMVAFRHFGRAVPAFGATGDGPVKRPASLVSLALAARIHAAVAQRELSPMLPVELLSDLFLVNVFAATLAWCSDPIAPLPVVLGGVTQIFLHGIRGGAFATVG